MTVERCEECGFVYDSTEVPAVIDGLRALPPRYGAVLRAADRAGLARTRPQPATWSALEYTCHVRDVLTVQRERLDRVLREERPVLATMRRDERAVEERYNEQPAGTVLAELAEVARQLAGAFGRVDEGAWDRGAVYPWPEPAERSLRWLARHTLHEGLHHLEDVAAGLRALGLHPPPSTRDGAVAALPTPVLADALVRLGLPARQAPAGLVAPRGVAVAGRALPVRHSGSVDVFLEALGDAAPGDVMVIDNAGRRDEACIGDLVVHEARDAGVAGIVVWGLHRDAVEVEALGLPVFSYGTVPFGPRADRPLLPDRLTGARFGEALVTRADVVAADANGAVFLPGDDLEAVASAAASIRAAEAEQVTRLRAGASLRDQLAFDAYLRDRERDPDRTFRQHLRERGRAVEE